MTLTNTMRPARFSDDFYVAYLPTCGGDIARFSIPEEPGKGVST